MIDRVCTCTDLWGHAWKGGAGTQVVSRDCEVHFKGSYGPERGAAMSERISFTYEELDALWLLLSEAREGMDEDATEDELEVYNGVTEKVRRAFAKAQRKRADSDA